MASAVNSELMRTVKFRVNVPERVALKFAEGIAVQSRFSGDQIMYTLTDDRRMYVDPYVADRIEQLGIGAHEEFEICKRETQRGNRRIVDFEVKKLETETGAQSGKIAAPVSPSRQQVNPPTPQMQDIPTVESNAAALLRMSGIAAVDAVLDIEAYARQRGMTDFTFGVDNIQKFAACLFIELAKKGARA